MITLQPIGYVRSARNNPSDDRWGGVLARIELAEDMPSECLDGLEAFSHIEVFFHFDRVPEAKIERGARHPRGNPAWPRVGIFAQRSKGRPNRLGSTFVRLTARTGRALEVEGLDAIDGTPVLDIKPVMHEFLPRGPIWQPAWAHELLRNYWATPGTERSVTGQVSVILAHPDPQSFNHAIAQAVAAELRENGREVAFHDLYAEGFDPILPAGEIPMGASLPGVVEAHCREIGKADGIVIVHPNWWGQPPAILKGWVDRVLRPGVAYQFREGDQGEGVPLGLLRAKAALVFNTSNTSAEREMGSFGDPLETLWKNCIFGLCGVSTFHRETFSVVVTSTADQRQAWLAQVREVVRRHFSKESRA